MPQDRAQFFRGDAAGVGQANLVMPPAEAQALLIGEQVRPVPPPPRPGNIRIVRNDRTPLSVPPGQFAAPGQGLHDALNLAIKRRESRVPGEEGGPGPAFAHWLVNSLISMS